MAEIMRKKRNEVIHKVTVKLNCGCYGQACGCRCTNSAHTTTTTTTDTDASCCAELFARSQKDDAIVHY